ncbi:3-hydroxyacyl-CoA dehydrogenase [Plasmodiophora brassicae]|uniref:Ketoreductase domain-containing protein n=1 Tax=Plasmodiophora brassicae TaxID=37360 RepID=A0A0G4J733_PLABS|nr:hypothetical protein PBRA_003092 [Plasmodiophora brassicae]SPQ95573.1 unnamed protein product [Plasmodiophora brassicae]
MKVEGNVFVVTGAGSGLGRATCDAIVRRGGRVIALDMNAKAGEELVADHGSAVFFAVANVLDSKAVSGALTAGQSKLGPIRGLVSCAGIGRPRKVLSSKGPHSLEDFQTVINVNLVGTFNVLRLVCEQIAKNPPTGPDQERGVIINVSSVAAKDGQIGQASYSASKAAVDGMNLPLARELAAHGIRVLSIAPGIFITPMAKELSPQVQASLAKQVPFPPRLGNPPEFAALCIAIIENPYLNGESIRLDGSIRMSAM